MLNKMINSAVDGINYILIDSISDNLNLKNKKLLFALELEDIGYDISTIYFLSQLYKKGMDSLSGSTAMVLVHSPSDLGTKRAAQDLIFLANNLGCSFIGHPLVEATNSLKNFLTWQKTINIPLEDLCLKMCSRTANRLMDYNLIKIESPKILVLYSSPHKRSNTLDLWHMVSENLKNYSIKELQIENGEVQDCKGCNYNLCIHYGKQNKCFYGGIMIKEVLPSIEASDIIIWLCPNYNDSIAANLTAVINRLTVLYRKISFYDKCFFSLVVSGNSGSDSVAKQLIGSLNINKGFRLPPYFSLIATANNPGSIFKIKDIKHEAYKFSKNIMNNI